MLYDSDNPFVIIPQFILVFEGFFFAKAACNQYLCTYIFSQASICLQHYKMVGSSNAFPRKIPGFYISL
jgi:hypothetical protein